MIVHYYEASALANPGNQPGRLATLNDRHKTAWRLFTGGADHPEEERPFLFRAEALAPSHELFMLHSIQPFEGAKEHRLDLSEGTMFNIEWVTVPTVSVFRRGERGRRRQAKKEEWGSVGMRQLNHAGLTLTIPESMDYRLHDKRPQFTPDKPPAQLVKYRAQVKVADSAAAARAWINGLGRQKAYGMGMICLADLTTTESEKSEP